MNNGCKENDYCHPKGTGTGGVLCEGFCPTECSNSEHKCSSPNDPITDCVKKPVCVPKQKDIWGYNCRDQVCPVECEDTEILCIGPKNYRGCKIEDTCVPKDTDNSGELCPGTCPVECDDDELLCEGKEDANGCKSADVCVTKVRDKNGDYCPDNSASHGCPANCEDYEILCPPKTDSLGCMEEAICVNRTIDNNGNLCPEDNECPVDCPPGLISCPGPPSEDGCKIKETCEVQEKNIYGELCTIHCANAPTCKDDEIFCPGPRNDKGCTDPHQCIKRGIKTKGDDKGGECPGWCRPVCDRDEILCPTYEDPCDGCPVEEVCRIAYKDVNGIFCSGKDYPNAYVSASHSCPKLCNTIEGYTLCPATEMDNGCKLESICLPRSKDNRGEYCPGISACPQYCKNNEILCEYGIDVRGCKEPAKCFDRGTDRDGNPCPGLCTPVCRKDQALQHGGSSANGCLHPKACQGKGFYLKPTND